MFNPHTPHAAAVSTPARAHVSTEPFFNQLFSFSKLLVVVLGPVSVEELVSVKDALFAPVARYRI